MLRAMNARFRLIAAHDPEWIPTVRALFEEYGASLGFHLCFQSFDDELRTLPGKYAPPAGRIYLALTEAADAAASGVAVGCVALRPLEDGACELKRMYVRPDWRRAGVARALAERLIVDARAIGYRVMRLDTLHTMTAANRLYEALGFRDAPAYCYNPFPEARYMEFALAEA